MSEELAALLHENFNHYSDFLCQALHIPDEKWPSYMGLDLVGDDVWLRIVINIGPDEEGRNQDDVVFTFERTQEWACDVSQLARSGRVFNWA